MQTGEYIAHRLMVEIIRAICLERGITFTSLSDDWILELEKNRKIKRVVGYSFSVNDSVSALIAKDKVAAHLLLKKAGVPSVPHFLLRPRVSDAQKNAIQNFGIMVVKPLDGTGGHGVKLVGSPEEAVAWVESTDLSAWAAAPFVDIKREIRFVLLDQKPLIVYEKQAVIIEGLKMFNLGKGASPKDIVPSNELLQLAADAQSALGLRLSAVDIVETMSGEYQVLEINSGFMMEHYMRVSEENYQNAVKAYNKIIDSVMEG